MGPSKNGRETANQGGKDIKEKANGTNQDCFSDWFFFWNLRLRLDKGKIWFCCGVV